jgi:hypothetical protein
MVKADHRRDAIRRTGRRTYALCFSTTARGVSRRQRALIR